ncbi:hypothetical protein ACN47E_003509 [Coniothyrium glycines]
MLHWPHGHCTSTASSPKTWSNFAWSDSSTKTKPIKQINTKIARPSSTISDEFIAAVLTMASFEALLGAYDAAHLHTTALQRMLATRGGLSSLPASSPLLVSIL